MSYKVKNIIMWALTYRCNMHCEYCFLREQVKCYDELSDEECIETAKKMANDDSWRPDAVWLTGGEPTVRKCLPEIINILESGGIKCVVTTNAFCSDEVLTEILNAKPRGINVSLEAVDDETNSKNRGNTANVIRSIENIAKNKSEDTILGVSCVVSPENIGKISAFSEEIKKLGAEYLSVNPLIGGNCRYTAENFSEFGKARDAIRASGNVMLPSEFYFELVEDFFLDKNEISLPCPAGEHYMFIAPWGGVYPCSNEIWQKTNENEILLQNEPDIKQALAKLNAAYAANELSTKSSCFGERCIGCWKLYYDTIFTK